MKRSWIFLAIALVASPLMAQFNTTGTTTVSVTPAAEAAIEINTSSTSLTSTGTIFNNYTGTTNFTYKIRTSASGSTITLKVTSDFAPSGGPSVTTPPTAGDALTYTCTVTSPGTACSGTQTASTGSSTSVATFAAGVSSTFAGNTGSVSWTLTNDPVYKVGSYSATVTFTISAS